MLGSVVDHSYEVERGMVDSPARKIALLRNMPRGRIENMEWTAFCPFPVTEVGAMNTGARFGVRFSLGLLVAGAAVGCIDRPKDETVIASRSTPVSFHGFTTSQLGTADDADTAANTFYLFAWDPVAYRWKALSAAVHPNRDPFQHGNYDWHALDFGERVIPTWAWYGEPARWHAELRIATSSSWLAWFLYSFTSDELDCYTSAIDAGGDLLGAARQCGGDSIIDLYVNK